MKVKNSKNSSLVIMGVTSAKNHLREKDDYYATDPKAIEILLNEEVFYKNIWECACGEGHISKVLERYGYNVKSTDLIDRGYGISGIDFLSQTDKFDGDIVTNPPYKHALEFCQKALELVQEGHKVAMFLKLTFLESKKRKNFFLNNPPKVVYINSSRVMCAKSGNFDKYSSSAIAYAWFVWEKGFKGDTIIKWIN